MEPVTDSTEMKRHNTVKELIDSGNIKFKYGLVWYLIYPIFENESDYHYQDLLPLSAEDIHKRLKEAYDKVLAHAIFNGFSSRDHCTMYLPDMIAACKKDISFEMYVDGYENFDVIKTLSEFMYMVLTCPHEYYRKQKLFDIVCHAANRVCRNYHMIDWVQYDPEHCYEIINKYYYQEKFGAKNFKCSW